MKTIFANFIGVAVVTLTITFTGCTEPELPSETEDFFPLSGAREWRYQRWISNGDTLRIFDTLSLRVGQKTTVDGQMYHEITTAQGFPDKLIRVEGSKYYGRDHELYMGITHEYLFLDTEKEEGDSWEYLKDDGYTKTEYIIRSKGRTRIIGGVRYEKVIEVEVNYYNRLHSGEYEKWVTAVHCYAEGIGEIYHYYPYPVSHIFGDITSYILK